MGEVGKEIRRMRKDKDWTQTELAVYAGSSQPTINQIESGARNPSTRTLEKIAGALGVGVADLFPKGQAPLPFDDPERTARWRLYLHVRPWISYFEKLAQGWEQAAEPDGFEVDTFKASTQIMAGLFDPHNQLWDTLLLFDEAWAYGSELDALDALETKPGQALVEAYERLEAAAEKLAEAAEAHYDSFDSSEFERARQQRDERRAAFEEVRTKPRAAG